MNDQVIQLLENYKNGIPIRIERSTIIMLAVSELLVIIMGAAIVKIIKKA